MSWLRRTAALATPLAAPVPVAPEPTPAVEHSAPGLREALARLPRPGAAVLDLGTVSSVNVDFFNRLQARLAIFDFEGTLDEAGLWAPPAKLAPWIERIPAALDLGAARYDLILAWDFSNYLGRDRWPAVASELAQRLAPQGSLHLLVRSGKTMPSRPGRYRLASKETIVEEAHAHGFVPAPRFAHAEIERLHPGLAAAKSFLDKHGVQEIVLERSERLNLPSRPQVGTTRQRREATYEPGIAAGVTTSGAHRAPFAAAAGAARSSPRGAQRVVSPSAQRALAANAERAKSAAVVTDPDDTLPDPRAGA